MAGFFHFIPGTMMDELCPRGRFDRQVLARCGLAAVLADCDDVPDHAVVTETKAGPSGTPGVVIYPKTLESPPGWHYRPDHQEWVQCGDRWIGWERESPPSPQDLARRQVLPDYVVRDAEEREWFVPCARSSDANRSSLPVEYAFNGDGRMVRQVPQSMEHLWQLSGQVLDHLSGRVPQNEQWEVEAALAVMQVNYRIDKGEVTALQSMGRAVLTKGTVRGILGALVDNDLEQEYVEQKKSETPDSQSLP